MYDSYVDYQSDSAVFNAHNMFIYVGYFGIRCEDDVNECAILPCGDHGVCIDKVNSYECHCNAGYTGTDCDTEIDECLSNPCQNNGTCTDGHLKYVCSNSGWCNRWSVGAIDLYSVYNWLRLSRIIITDSMTLILAGRLVISHSNATQHVNNDNGVLYACFRYTCFCPPGYEGTDCEARINHCEPNPCADASTCLNQLTDFSCVCPPGSVY